VRASVAARRAAKITVSASSAPRRSPPAWATQAVQERRPVRLLAGHRAAPETSSGGKASLGRITKRGDDYLRTLLVQGARAAVMSAGNAMTRSRAGWCNYRSVGWQKACVAMANKNARILWSVITRDQGFDPHHVSVKPLAKQPAHSVAAPAMPPKRSGGLNAAPFDQPPTTIDSFHRRRALEDALTGQNGSR